MTPSPMPKKVFVSSVVFTGNLGGLAGADAKCAALALAASPPLSGTYKAWVADSGGSPATRFTHSTGPYVLVNGTVVADSWTSLTSGVLAHAINRTQNNGAAPTASASLCGSNQLVWSNVQSNGTVSGTISDCTQWTNGTAGNNSAEFGNSSKLTGQWTSYCPVGGTGICNIAAPIYCFEQ